MSAACLKILSTNAVLWLRSFQDEKHSAVITNFKFLRLLFRTPCTYCTVVSSADHFKIKNTCLFKKNKVLYYYSNTFEQHYVVPKK